MIRYAFTGMFFFYFRDGLSRHSIMPSWMPLLVCLNLEQTYKDISKALFRVSQK